MIDVKATLETRQKKDKSGSYEVVVLKLSENSEKLVFLNPAELELLKLYSNKNNSNSSDVRFPDMF